MIIAVDTDTVNVNRFKKWVDFQDGETPIAWFSKGFISYKKGWLFTDQRMIEFEKKNTLQAVPLDQFSKIIFHTAEFMDEPSLNLKSVKGALNLTTTDGNLVKIPVDHDYNDLLSALKAVDAATQPKIEFTGQQIFTENLSDITMRMRGKTVFVVVNEYSFASSENNEQAKAQLFGDKSHIETLITEPKFQFEPKCAWTGVPTAGAFRDVTVQSHIMDLKDFAAFEQAGRALKALLLPSLTGPNPQKSTIRFTIVVPLPVSADAPENEKPQLDLNVYPSQGKVELGITFPTAEEAKAFQDLNT